MRCAECPAPQLGLHPGRGVARVGGPGASRRTARSRRPGFRSKLAIWCMIGGVVAGQQVEGWFPGRILLVTRIGHCWWFELPVVV